MRNWIPWLVALTAMAPAPTFADSRCANYLQIVPLIAQQTDFTCGAACARSLIQHFRGRNLTEFQLALAMDTFVLGYTPVLNLQDLLAQHGLRSQLEADLSLDDLRLALARGERVIVMVTLERDPHYAVLSGLSDTHVTLMDPWVARQNAYSTMSLGEFRNIWSFTLNGKTQRRAALRVWPVQ